MATIKSYFPAMLAVALLWATSFPGVAGTPAPGQPEMRVLLVGNSLVYTNNLPGLLRALAAAQPGGPRIVTETYAAPGGTLAERWNDGEASAALAAGRWDAIVLQERGGLLACMVDREGRQQSDCRDSERAHREFAGLAASRGARTLLLATWGPDATWQLKLDRATRLLASRIAPEDARATVVPAGSTLRLFATRHSEAETFPDGTHPSTQASLIMAAQLYHTLTGRDAQAADIAIDFPLLPVNARVEPDTALERQAPIAGDGRTLVIQTATVAPLLRAASADLPAGSQRR